MTPSLRPSDFKRIAFRATGGKVKAIYWHLGVRAALEHRGFTFTSGFGSAVDPTPGDISLLVGSSAGSVFAILAAAGFDVPSIINAFVGRKSDLPRITNETIFRKQGVGFRGYFRRIRNAVNLRAGAELFPGTGPGDDPDAEQEIHANYELTMKKMRSHFHLSDLLVLRSHYTLTGMEEWFRLVLGEHDAFDELRTKLFILTSDLDMPKTWVFGSREQDCVWYQYASGVKPSRAAAASMAIPSLFNPVSIKMKDRKHYFIDGDVYNPTEAMVESDHNCDLAIISSFEAPYRFHSAIGSLHHLGLPYEVTQAIALTIYNRLMQSRNTSRSKAAGLAAARDALARHVDEETLEAESRRIAAALEMTAGMKIVHLHPFRNPLLFFESPFDLSSRTMGRMIVEASLQSSELLDRAGFKR
jgi:predicted acylesterase/phospholipase RssA